MEQFLEFLKYERNYSDNTILSYQKELIKYKNYLEKNNINYKLINKEEIRSYLKKLDESKYKNTSISKNVSCIRSFYHYLQVKKEIKTNIWDSIKNPKIKRQIPNFLTTLEIEKVFQKRELKRSEEHTSELQSQR